MQKCKQALGSGFSAPRSIAIAVAARYKLAARIGTHYRITPSHIRPSGSSLQEYDPKTDGNEGYSYLCAVDVKNKRKKL
jgi:hypothetical protein